MATRAATVSGLRLRDRATPRSRVAKRLGGGTAGGVLAAACLMLSTDFLRFAAVGDSEGLLVALLFAALDLHLSGRTRAALWACFGAALLRPESWPFVGLYALW